MPWVNQVNNYSPSTVILIINVLCPLSASPSPPLHHSPTLIPVCWNTPYSSSTCWSLDNAGTQNRRPIQLSDNLRILIISSFHQSSQEHSPSDLPHCRGLKLQRTWIQKTPFVQLYPFLAPDKVWCWEAWNMLPINGCRLKTKTNLTKMARSTSCKSTPITNL